MERDFRPLLDLLQQMKHQEKEKNRLRDQYRRQADKIAALQVAMEQEKIRDFLKIRHLQEKIKFLENKFDQFKLPQYEWHIENFSSMIGRITGKFQTSRKRWLSLFASLESGSFCLYLV